MAESTKPGPGVNWDYARERRLAGRLADPGSIPGASTILSSTHRAAHPSPVRTDELVLSSGMSKRLTRSGNSLALVIDRPLLDALEIDADTELELSTDGDVLVVTPVRNRKRKKRTAELVAEAHEQYGGVFRRLAE